MRAGGFYLSVPEVCGNMVCEVAELESQDLVHDIKPSESSTISIY